jgi:hypothetical protein
MANKLWGWLLIPDSPDLNSDNRLTYYRHVWCWWAEAGKNISVKRHLFNRTYIRRLESKKLRNGYVPITRDELILKWPDFDSVLDNKMIFELLRQDAHDLQP